MRVLLVFIFSLLAGAASAQSHSQFFDYIGLNTYWNGTSWTSYAPGYGSMFTTDSTTGEFTLYNTGNAASAGLARTLSPVMAVTAAGTISATRFVGDGSGLTGVVASTGDRIVSGTTSMIAFNSTGLISITQAGTNTGYFHPSLGLVTLGVSSTGGISATTGYFNGAIVTLGKITASSIWPGTGFGVYWGIGGTDTFTGDGNSHYLAFSTSGTEAMRIIANGRVGIGTAVPSGTLHVSGSIRATQGVPAADNALVGYAFSNDGDTGMFSAGSGSSAGTVSLYTNATERMRLSNSGTYLKENVGIGTDSPSNSLHIVGPQKQIHLQDSDDPNGHWSLGTYSTDNRSFYILDDNANPRFILTENGRVSIGSDAPTPTVALTVSGTIRMTDGGEACDANRTGAIKYTGSDFYVCRNGTAWESLASIAAGGASVTDGLSGSLVFRDGTGVLHGHPTISISSTTGSVGIGAGAPASLGNNGLYVGSNITAGGAITTGAGWFQAGTGYGLNWGGTNATSISGDSTAGNKYIAFTPSGSEVMRIVSSGLVGIGTSNPSSTLHVYGQHITVGALGGINGIKIARGNDGALSSFIGYADSTTGREFRFEHAGGLGYFTWKTNFNSITQERMRLGNEGNLGIGTATPTVPLEVSGTVSATRFVGDGGGLTNLAAASVADGLSGSLVFRDGMGALHGHPQISVSSTTWSVGIGAGAPAWVGNYGLYAGTIYGNNFYTPSGSKYAMFTGTNGVAYEYMTGDSNAGYHYLSFATSATEAMRIVSNSYVGIGTSTPKTRLDVNGHIGLPSEGSLIGFGGYFDNTALTYRNRDAGKFAAILRIGTQSSAQGGDMQFMTESSSTAAVAADTAIAPALRMVIRRAGDVRIGGNAYIGSTVVTPTTPLEVDGTISATNAKFAGTMTVGSYSSAPVTCSASYKGMLAMNSTDNLCLCNGTAWVGVGTGGTACPW